MSHDGPGAAAFTGLVDLLAEELGGRAIATNDDFFAGVENLMKPGRGVFLPDEYTERGKWMDGWESRRRREPGHDWCIVALGAPGVVRGLDIDTNHFLGNHAPYASVEACYAPKDATAETLVDASWVEILPQAPLRPGSQNLFAVNGDGVYTHLRLHIYPDGGVARFRVYGEVVPDWSDDGVDELTAAHHQTGEVDLAAVRNGGVALACSDMFFGPMNNLLAPGRSVNMGGGWETRRRRGPGDDWILVRLAARGEVGFIELDTNFFKGNYPDSCALYGIDAEGARITDIIASEDFEEILPRTKLAAHERRFVRDGLEARGPFTHVLLRIYPDGGISRLRVWGTRTRDGAGEE